MSELIRGKSTGETIENYLPRYVGEIANDEIGIGLCSIVGEGRDEFGLDGPALMNYVRRALVVIASSGATPEDASLVTSENPQGLAHFGTDTPEEIADGVVAAWVAKGMPDPEWGDWRFNTAENRATLDEFSGRDFYGSPTKG
ncbi:MAG: hypothetical protein GX458_01785 [Phyllobacteriaceae bacterium]|nr:hypothetical protein [Phyllobacteriaceae bacterium]